MPIPGLALENTYALYVIGADGSTIHLIDKRSGIDYCVGGNPWASVIKDGRSYNATDVSNDNGRITVGFAEAGANAVIVAKAEERFFDFQIVSVSSNVDELVFTDTHLTLRAEPDEPFACCAMALNLKTNSPEIPGLNNRLRASCYAYFGFEGARAAIVACPTEKMRDVMKEVIKSAPDIPLSELGGPWAWDAEINRGSYLFNFGDLSEETADEWIKLAKSLGCNQIDFHGGLSFRMGDLRPNPETYPRGRASLKAVIDRLHYAGIKAGLHTYVWFMDKACPWVTPVPDPRLGTDAVFTLAETVSDDSAIIPVVESTEQMSTITGFFERNSVTLRIDEELVTYTGISKTPPYSFTGCERGALGTKASSHNAGAKVYHIKECFGYFAPDGEGTLLTELAAVTADTFNECGFDMMYLDALDGEDILGGRENGWHYGSKFVYELCKRLDKPALMEMSTFHHHLWYVRSRIGAMDYPTRSQKRFIDIHCHGSEDHVHAKGNLDSLRMFLPAELGWWAVHTGGNIQVERTFTDDIEYLMCKGMSTDTGFALIGVDTKTIKDVPAFQRLAPIFNNYEDLRHAHYFPQSVLDRLAVPKAEYTLEQTGDEWRLRPIEYSRHKVERVDGISNCWTVNNRFGQQPLQIRIEALMSAAPYDSPDAIMLADFADPTEFTRGDARENVTMALEPSSEQVKEGVSGRLSAHNTGDSANGAWCSHVKLFAPNFDLSDRQALGLWVYGDGNGELLNLQVKSPEHLAWGIGDHYVDVNFTGWRYFEMIEPEGGRIHDLVWPYGRDLYGVYREQVDYNCVERLSIWLNMLPPGKEITTFLSPIKALPLVKAILRNPSVSIGGKTIIFPIDLESDCYLEYRLGEDCVIHGPKGEIIATVKSEGDIPLLSQGENDIQFSRETVSSVGVRAYVTVITQGEATMGRETR